MAAQTPGQRISQLISHLGISKNAFAASLDKTATVIQHLVDERNKPGFDLLCRIFEIYPNVSKDWLLQGNGPMLLGVEAVTPNGTTAPATEETSPAPAPEIVRPTVPPEPIATAIQPIQSTSPPQPEPNSAPIAETSVASAPPIAAATVLNQASTNPAAPAPVVDPTASLQAALYAQQLSHQLALAEMRNQHLQEQQRMMQQMMEMMQRQLSR